MPPGTRTETAAEATTDSQAQVAAYLRALAAAKTQNPFMPGGAPLPTPGSQQAQTPYYAPSPAAGPNRFFDPQIGNGDPQVLAYLKALDEAGGSSGGSGGPATPAPAAPSAIPAYNYKNDPGYLALIRALDLEGSGIQAGAAGARSRLASAQGVSEADLNRQERDSLENVDTNYESRGLYRSGERLGKLQEVGNDYDARSAGLTTQYAGQTSQVDADMNRALAEIARRKAEADATYARPPAALAGV